MFAIERFDEESSNNKGAPLPIPKRRPPQAPSPAAQQNKTQEERDDPTSDEATPPVVSPSPVVSSSITVVHSQRDLKRLRASALATTRASEEFDEEERRRRKEEKKLKKSLRRQKEPRPELDEETEQILSQVAKAAPQDSLKHKILQQLKERQEEEKEQTCSNPSLTSSGQHKRDPELKALERAARKVARLRSSGLEIPEALLDAEKKLENIENEKENKKIKTKLNTAKAPVAELLPRVSAPVGIFVESEAQPAALEPLPLEAPDKENAKNATKALNARPSWMSRGKVIDPEFTVPISYFNLAPPLAAHLSALAIDHFFPIQAEVIPVIMQAKGFSDIAVCAATGSGKTLAYLLPVLQSLSGKLVRKLRALILLPSRDLAMQVKGILDGFAEPLGLRTALITGQSSFVQEQHMIVERCLSEDSLIGPIVKAGEASVGPDYHYSSCIDILVATPGRLFDHLAGTAGFDLSDLEFLVFDEVDRLLSQHYQDWAKQIQKAIHNKNKKQAEPTTEEATAEGEDFSSSLALRLPSRSNYQQLLFSATLTSNPAKLALLNLQNPIFFTESNNRVRQFVIPPGLTGQKILVEPAEKPLALIQLLDSVGLRGSSSSPCQVVVFTASIENSHRLYRLLEVFGGFRVCQYSSLLPQRQRSRFLEHFRARKFDILVCSDAFARGLDIPAVSLVVNYDPPVFIQNYIHRVGRTARAGAEGRAVTILKRPEVKFFHKIMKRATNSFLETLEMPSEWRARHSEAYAEALLALKRTLAEEKQGKLEKTQRTGKGEKIEQTEAPAVDESEWNFQTETAVKSTSKKHPNLPPAARNSLKRSAAALLEPEKSKESSRPPNRLEAAERPKTNWKKTKFIK